MNDNTAQPGEIRNGYVWTGDQWVALATPSPPSQGISTTRVIVASVAFVVAGVAALMGISWMFSFVELNAKGNDFAGLLALFGMGALTVAAGFGITGVLVLTRK